MTNKLQDDYDTTEGGFDADDDRIIPKVLTASH